MAHRWERAVWQDVKSLTNVQLIGCPFCRLVYSTLSSVVSSSVSAVFFFFFFFFKSAQVV
ncbi:hypothetical protein LZ32DRAFT_112144 [Colletotrichum eremochloae]|nr:hypothetical protein LZ32DRAFT_112144 [Colletotrichum eremochloae]